MVNPNFDSLANRTVWSDSGFVAVVESDVIVIRLRL